MHIAYICADRGVALDGSSGSSTHVREMVRAFAERDVRVTLYVASSVGDRRSRALYRFKVVDLSSDDFLNELRVRTAKALREQGRDAIQASELYGLLLNQRLSLELGRNVAIDLVYERQSLWSLAGLQFASDRGIPFFLEVNAPLTEQQREYRELDLLAAASSIEQILYENADRIFVTTNALVDYVHDRGGSGRKVRVLPCGVPKEMLVREPRVRPLPDQTFVLGFLGSLKPWHGIDILLEAFLELHRLSENYRLLVVGDGPMRSEIESFCMTHELDDYVTVTGAVRYEDVARFLARMDVGLAPYPRLNSFYFSPLKIWEYAAAGVPVIASDLGEIASVLPHRQAALLHPPGRVGKIVRHVERLRNDPDLATRLARRARRVARARTWDRLAARVLKARESFARS